MLTPSTGIGVVDGRIYIAQVDFAHKPVNLRKIKHRLVWS